MYSWEIDNTLKSKAFWFDTYWDLEKIRLSSPQLYKMEIIDDNEECVQLKLSTTDNWNWNVFVKHKTNY